MAADPGGDLLVCHVLREVTAIGVGSQYRRRGEYKRPTYARSKNRQVTRITEIARINQGSIEGVARRKTERATALRLHMRHERRKAAHRWVGGEIFRRIDAE